jgi:ABC-type transport system substrate-binding protein
LIVVLLALAVATVQSQVTTGGRPKRGGTLTVGLERDISILNPFAATFSQNQFVREMMYDALLAYDDSGEISPNLAQSWTISPDGKVYTFRIRRGVKFHNGKELTAEDTAWTINYIRNPKNAAYAHARSATVIRAEAQDPYTMRVFLQQPTPGLLAAFSEIKVGIVVGKESVEEGRARPTAFPSGTGPFKFVDWLPQQRIVFERFADYWGPQKPLLDRVVFRPIEDGTVRFAALRAGDLDMMRGTAYQLAQEIREGKFQGITSIEPRFTQNKRIAFNVVGSPFENKKLRQAVAYAINQKDIIDGVYYGLADPIEQQYPKGHEWYIKGVPTFSYDPEKARALLNEAGYKGETFDLLVPPESDDPQVASIIQNQLRKIGMSVNLKVTGVAARETIAQKGAYQMDQRGANFDPDPSVTYDADFKCDEKRVSNRTGYCDKEVDALLDRARVELDVAKRKELFKQVLTKGFYEDAVYVPIGFMSKPFALRDHVKGFTTNREAKFRWSRGGVHYVWLDK